MKKLTSPSPKLQSAGTPKPPRKAHFESPVIQTPLSQEPQAAQELLAVRYEANPPRSSTDLKSRSNYSSSGLGASGTPVKAQRGQVGRRGLKGTPYAQLPVGPHNGLQKRKVDKRMVGPPTDFRHVCHAENYEQASRLLVRWAVEGVGDKIGDPAWVKTMRDTIRKRAKEQQRKTAAAALQASAGGSRSTKDGDARPKPSLRIANGKATSLYSAFRSPASPSLALATGDPTSRPLDAAVPAAIESFAEQVQPSFHILEATPTSPLPNPFATPIVTSRTATPAILPSRSTTAPLRIKKRSPPSPSATDGPANAASSPGREEREYQEEHGELGEIAREMASSPKGKEGLPASSSLHQIIDRDRDAGSAVPDSPDAEELATPKPIEPTLPMLEKAMSIALYFEQYYHGLFTPSPTLPESKEGASRGENQARRLAESTAAGGGGLRTKRQKVGIEDFELGRVIGHGAFGVVRIGREKSGGRLVAVKELRKSDMLRKSQEGHIKAEKDLLAAASSRLSSPARPAAHSWIVQLHYAFQDPDRLYLVLEYMAGSDLLNLLVARDTFSESMTRFYVAEMILALEETHALGYVHRDIKPDNFLFTSTGHIRLGDFGLSTDLDWRHDTNFYEHSRAAMLKKHGLDLEYGGGGAQATMKKRMKREDVEKILGREWEVDGEWLLSWRRRNRRRMAYSVCGYMAPEVIRGKGYGFGCDWWSLGVIMYECLYGYPPFSSSSRQVTRQRILNWKDHLRFPKRPRLSAECVDLLRRLLCEPEDRIGATVSVRSTMTDRERTFATLRGKPPKPTLGEDGVEEIKAHAWFDGFRWNDLHKMAAPYHPNLRSEDDTRHFDSDIPDTPLLPPGGDRNATKDPMLAHEEHGEAILEIRKRYAFKGWTFRSPTANTRGRGRVVSIADDPRAELKDAGSLEDASEVGEDDRRVGDWVGTVRYRASSL